MQEEINLYIDAAEEAMQKAISHTENAFSKIRAGKKMKRKRCGSI